MSCLCKLTNPQIWASLFLARHTVISAIGTLHSNRKNSWEPIKAATVKADSLDIDAHFALGLAEVLSIWVKKQHAFEVKLRKGLTDEQLIFLDGKSINPKKYGCVLPPSFPAMPNILHKDFEFTKTDKLTEEHRREMKQCLQILLSSHHPWSAQFSSSPHQHHIGIAISTMQLSRDEHIYTNYLGEDIVWQFFSKILSLIHKLAPSFQPWHGISLPENRVSNPIQVVLRESLRHEAIGSLLGATMAQSTASINDRYRVGLKQVSKVVQDMAVYRQDGQEYISYDVNLKLRELYQVCHSAIFINSVNIENILTQLMIIHL